MKTHITTFSQETIMNFSLSILVLMLSGLAGCGADPKAAPAAEDQPKAAAKAGPDEAAHASKDSEVPSASADPKRADPVVHLLAAGAELPACDKSNDSVIYYVADAGIFQACSKGAWAEIDMRGKNGADGKVGARGQDGAVGRDGLAGAQGVAGPAGAAAVPGRGSAAIFRKADNAYVGAPFGSGSEIGIVFSDGASMAVAIDGNLWGGYAYETEEASFPVTCSFAATACAGPCIIATASGNSPLIGLVKGSVFHTGSSMLKATGLETNQGAAQMRSYRAGNSCQSVAPWTAASTFIPGGGVWTPPDNLPLPLGALYYGVAH